MIESRVGPCEIHKFKSYNEYVTMALGPSEMRNSERSSQDKDREFYGKSWKDSVETAPTGDLEAAKKLRGSVLKEAALVAGKVTRLDPQYKEEGGIWIDISRYLAGEPEAWGDLVNQGAERRGRRVSLMIQGVVSAANSAEAYAKAARLVAGAILGLRTAGHTLDVWLGYRNTRGYEYHSLHAIPLTGTGGLDVAKLAAAFSPWFFRRIWFAYVETLSATYRSHFGIAKSAGYGRHGAIQPCEADAVTGQMDTCILDMSVLLNQSEDRIRELIIEGVKRRAPLQPK